MSKRANRPVEEVYKKMTQLEHVINRPDTYVGSVQMQEEQMWVWSEEKECMEQRKIKFVPGLYKIFDEILVNAADNKIRDPQGTC
jgi:DNA topoisomerase-2